MPGQPRNKMRPFDVEVSNGHGASVTITVDAQTRNDAMFRAGVAVGARLLAAYAKRDTWQWTVTGVEDRAPGTY